jgi:hypothetical protein
MKNITSLPYPGQILETDKLGFRHEGLYVGNNQVIHCSPRHGGVTISPLSEFAGPAGVRVSSRYKPRASAERMVFNAYQQLQSDRKWWPWNNCQNFVSEIAELPSDSPQWRQLLVSAFIVGGIFTVMKAKA